MLNKFDNPLNSCEIKFAQDAATFSGYASVFGSVDSYGDTIVKGAFKDTIKNRTRPPLMLFGHNPGRPIGIWTELREDDSGLLVSGEFTPNHTDAANIRASMKHGAVDGLSIGFRIPTGGAEDTDSGGRLISKIDLVEISVVAMPAEKNARVDTSTVKSEIGGIVTIREAEMFLRDAGMWTRPMAKDFLSQLKTIVLRDAEVEVGQMKSMQDQVIRLVDKSDSIIHLLT